ncbi:hypothetical protein TNCV_1068471 [Trichonephila clavipes]|nr:hypothetical protein TNCV_1068471 [Trichonephila clavipes]
MYTPVIPEWQGEGSKPDCRQLPTFCKFQLGGPKPYYTGGPHVPGYATGCNVDHAKEAGINPTTSDQTAAPISARPKVPPIMFKHKKANYKSIVKNLNKDFPDCEVKLAGNISRFSVKPRRTSHCDRLP